MVKADIGSGNGRAGAISPAQRAVLDYGVAAIFFALGFSVLSRHRPAAALAFVNGALTLG